MSMVQDCRASPQFFETIMPVVVCFCASLFFFYEFIQGNMFASMADNVMHDFHLEAGKMAFLSSIYYVANVLFLLIAGIILDNFSTKKTMLIAMGVCVISTFILAQTHSFYITLICRFATGIGSAFCFLGPVRIASRWFPPQRMALVTGSIVTMAMTGGMLAQYPLTKLIAEIGWRDALTDIAWLGVAILLLMVFGVLEKDPLPATQRKKIPLLTFAKKMYLNPQTLKAALYASLMNMAIAVFGAMMGTLYLIERLGISKTEASFVNSMLFLGAIMGGPIIGWISDRMALRVLPMKVAGIFSLLIVLAILFLPVSLPMMKLLFFLLGFFTAAQIISYALVAESCSKALTATAVSVVSIVVQGGYIVYQNIYSLFLINYGDMNIVNGTPNYSLDAYQFAALILPVGLVIAFLALIRLKETHCRQIEE